MADEASAAEPEAGSDGVVAEEAAAAAPREVPGALPALGAVVTYREPAPGGAVVIRAAHVIAVDPETWVATLSVLTIVPPTAMVPRAQPCRLAVGVEYASEPRENTWGVLE